MSEQYRTVTLNEIGEDKIGQTVKLAGWIENIRDHGGVSFIDLRDMYGVVQVVLRDTSMLEGLTREDCVSIEGPVEKRDEETYNPKIQSGTVEVEAKSVTVLGKVYRQLPFEIMTSKETREDVRLKYRYLDLRNQKVKDKNVVLNDKDILDTIESIRKELDGNGQILVRASGTEPLVRVMVEAENDELCHKYVYKVIDLIKEKGYAI